MAAKSPIKTIAIAIVFAIIATAACVGILTFPFNF